MSDVDWKLDGCLEAAALQSAALRRFAFVYWENWMSEQVRSRIFPPSAGGFPAHFNVFPHSPVDHLPRQMAGSTRKKGFSLITEYPGMLRIRGRVAKVPVSDFRDLLVARLTLKKQHFGAGSPRDNISPTPSTPPGVLIEPVWSNRGFGLDEQHQGVGMRRRSGVFTNPAFHRG